MVEATCASTIDWPQSLRSRPTRLVDEHLYSRVGLEAQLLTVEHLLVKRYCCE